MPRCAKIHYRTRTRATRFGKPTGFPVPVTNPTYSTLITHSTPRYTSLCPGQILYKCIIVRFSIYGTNLQYSWSWSGSSSHIPTYWTLYISPLDESGIQG